MNDYDQDWVERYRAWLKEQRARKTLRVFNEALEPAYQAELRRHWVYWRIHHMHVVLQTWQVRFGLWLLRLGRRLRGEE